MVAINEAFREAEQHVNENDAEGLKRVSEDVMSTSRSYNANMLGDGALMHVKSVINNEDIAPVKVTPRHEYEAFKKQSYDAQKIWATISMAKRREFLKILSRKLKEVDQQIQFSICSNVAKSKKDTTGEMGKAGEWIDWALNEKTSKLIEPKRKKGEFTKIVAKDPAGMVGVMTSFNYPLALSIAGIIPALLSGNSVMFKSASIAPHWAYFFKDAFDSAMEEFVGNEKTANHGKTGHWSQEEGIEFTMKHLFSTIQGRENSLVRDCDNLFFVGGTDTGMSLLQQRLDATEEDGKFRTTHLELGGNSASIVLQSAFEECVDGAAIDARARKIAGEIFTGAMGNSGQRCTAARLFVRDGSAEAELVFKYLKELYETGIRVNNPFSDDTVSGAMADEDAYNKMQLLIAAANKVGASVIGGDRINNNAAPKGGIYVNPAIIDWANVPEETLDMSLIDLLGEDFVRKTLSEPEFEKWGRNYTLKDAMQHETFAPLLHVLRKVENREQAVQVVNEYDKEQLAVGAYANRADLDHLKEGIRVTSFKENGAPKDQSPNKEHGNWGRQFHTGGEHAFDSFTREVEYDWGDTPNMNALEEVHGIGLKMAA